jgi:hypothetical protein
MMSIEQAVGIQQGYFDFDPNDLFEIEERIYMVMSIEDKACIDFLIDLN